MSIRMAAMEPDSIRVTRSVVLPLSEIELRFSRSSGPGGQHANTAETRVEAMLDVEASSALTDAQKRRVLGEGGAGPARDRAGRAEPVAQPGAGGRAPRRAAAAGAEGRAPAVATRPTGASRERRLERRSAARQTKKLRRPPTRDLPSPGSLAGNGNRVSRPTGVVGEQDAASGSGRARDVSGGSGGACRRRDLPGRGVDPPERGPSWEAAADGLPPPGQAPRARRRLRRRRCRPRRSRWWPARRRSPDRAGAGRCRGQ